MAGSVRLKKKEGGGGGMRRRDCLLIRVRGMVFVGRWLWGILSARQLCPRTEVSGSQSPSPSPQAVSP